MQCLKFIDKLIMRRAEDEPRANYFSDNLIIFHGFIIVAHLRCSGSNMTNYDPSGVLYNAPGVCSGGV